MKRNLKIYLQFTALVRPIWDLKDNIRIFSIRFKTFLVINALTPATAQMSIHISMP